MRRLLSATLLPVCALTIGACANTTSTSGFKGAEHEVAQTVANLQADVTSSEEKKICSKDLAAAVVTKLGGKSDHCVNVRHAVVTAEQAVRWYLRCRRGTAILPTAATLASSAGSSWDSRGRVWRWTRTTSS